NEADNGTPKTSDLAGGAVVREIDLTKHPVTAVPSDCFWIGAVTRRDQALNILFPDAEATYWVSQFRIPAGAKLRLRGTYPHARYVSFTAYNSMGTPVDGVNDQMLDPDVGSTNPSIVGADRSAGSRQYTVELLDQAQPKTTEGHPHNVLFAKSDEPLIQLYYRVYVPDNGRDITGDVGLPRPELLLTDGKTLSGDRLCTSIVEHKGAVRDRP